MRPGYFSSANQSRGEMGRDPGTRSVALLRPGAPLRLRRGFRSHYTCIRPHGIIAYSHRVLRRCPMSWRAGYATGLGMVVFGLGSATIAKADDQQLVED